MLLTKSMRRKLGTILAMVVVLLALFTYSSAMGLRSSSRMVLDLKLSIDHNSSRDALIASFASLLKPLKYDFPDETEPFGRREEAAAIQYQQFCLVHDDVIQRVRQFRFSWQNLPENLRPGYAEESSYLSMFQTVDHRLDALLIERDFLADVEYREIFIADLIKTVAELTEIAERLPDPSNRLGERLKEAREDYRFHFRLVTAFGLISLVLFLFLMWLMRKWVFVPIAALAQGVEKIAKGNYSYRLKVDTACEISQMARSFNCMAAKIELDQRDKEREIQERSRLLVQSERLAGVGFLASGVAHEINNPLSVIMTAGSGVRRRLTDEALDQLTEKDRKKVLDYLDLIQSESERCEAITKKLLDFSYGNGDERNLYDVVAVCREVSAMVSHLGKYRSKSVTVDRSEPLHAWVNGPEMKQVVLNLVANALDASDEGGEVEVAVDELPDQVEIRVIDRGCGMTPEQQSKIFEPFFTTKEVGQGTGLGLSITHRIVVDHDGTLEVASDGPGQGATFTLRLPKSKPQQRTAA